MEIEIGGDLTVRVAVKRDKRVGGDDDVDVAQQHAHAHREKLMQDLELEACAFQGGAGGHRTNPSWRAAEAGDGPKTARSRLGPWPWHAPEVAWLSVEPLAERSLRR